MKSRSKMRNFWIILLIAGILILMFTFANKGVSGELLNSTQIEDMVFNGYYYEETIENDVTVSTKIETGYVTNMYASGGVVYVRVENTEYANKSFPKYSDFYFTYARSNAETLEYFYTFNHMVDMAKSDPNALVYSDDGVERSLAGLSEVNKISIEEVVATESIWDMIVPYLVMSGVVLIAGFFLIRMLSSKSGSGNVFTRNKARMVEKCNVRFADIAGAEEEKEETREVVEFLKDPSKFKALGARIPKGILLVGNPGTGKTLLAKAVAGESNVPFFSISGSDFVELYVGVGASRVRDLFETAKKNAPCIVFIDEIDAVGRQRGAGLGGGNDEREQTLNQLLVEMDGFDSSQGIIIMAATNRADVLDPALLRPGRFDRQIYVNVPDVNGREGIIKIHAKNKPIEEGVDFKNIARLTSGFTGADIENFLNEAAILAARDNRLTITMEDITEGINKVLMGPQKKSRLVTENDRKLTAYHESGHAIIAKFMDCGDTVHEVSIIPRGMAGGYTNIRPADDDSHYSLNKLNNRICMMMGGRIAEEIVFGDITAGASSDIQRATELARKMVVEWGMSEKLGFMSFGKNNEVFIGRDYQVQNQYSDATAKLIDDEIKRILDENYKRAKDLLKSKRKLLDSMSTLLLEEETIYSEEVDELIAGKDSASIIKRLHEKEEKRKAKEEEIRKEQELLRQAKLQELKIKAAEALKEVGVIGEEEFNKLKDDYDKINKEKEDYLKERNAELRKTITERLEKNRAKLESAKEEKSEAPKTANTKKVERPAKVEKSEDKPKKTTKTATAGKTTKKTTNEKKTSTTKKSSTTKDTKSKKEE